MDAPPKLVLFAGVTEALGMKMGRALEASGVQAKLRPWCHDIIDSVHTTPYDVVVVGYPVPGADFGRFLSALRSLESACRRAGLVLVAESGSVERATSFVGRGVNRVLMQSTPDDVLLETIHELLQVAPRVPVRTAARIVADVGRGPKLALLQTENLSLTGMLLRGWAHYPLGFSFEFELDIPGDSEPIRGRAMVSRITDPTRETFSGVGVSFESLMESDRERLEDFIADQLN